MWLCDWKKRQIFTFLCSSRQVLLYAPRYRESVSPRNFNRSVLPDLCEYFFNGRQSRYSVWEYLTRSLYRTKLSRPRCEIPVSQKSGFVYLLSHTPKMFCFFSPEAINCISRHAIEQNIVFVSKWLCSNTLKLHLLFITF